MTLRGDKDFQLSIPEYAREFVEEVNRKRSTKGDAPLNEEALCKLLDKLAEIRNHY